MQKLSFTKMHGIGNDYIYINCFNQSENAIIESLFAENKFDEFVINASKQHFGIGSDGLILILPSPIADAEMRIFNADASEAKMCGNGIRCVAKFLFDNELVKDKTFTVNTQSGIKTLEIVETSNNGKTAELIKVDMGATKAENHLLGTYVDVGNPHCVIFAPFENETPLNALNLEQIGPTYEKNPIFPEGVNTEFVEIISPTELKMRVWERGSGETFACGTGACAVATAAVFKGISPKNQDITVHLLGGNLIINVQNNTVFKTGPATTSFKGEILI